MRGMTPESVRETYFVLALAHGRGSGGVSRKASGSGALFEFAGSDAEFSELVKALVTAGAPLLAVEQPSLTLEEAYSRIAKGEVM